MQRLDQREDDPISVGELVRLDNLKGIDDFDGLFSDISYAWEKSYLQLNSKLNPPELVGRIIEIRQHPDIVIDSSTKKYARKIGLKEGSKLASNLPSVRVHWTNGQRNSYYIHNLREI